MELVTLIYVSSAVRSFKDSDIHDILRVSREANGRNGISGLLLFKDGNFMQILEGDSHAVDDLHLKITRDPRHTGIITLLRRPIQARNFSDWKMGFKDIGKLTEEEKSGWSDYLNRPLNGEMYVSNPNVAYIFLESFKQTVR
jgi:Sensors of blue-light using FAD